PGRLRMMRMLHRYGLLTNPSQREDVAPIGRRPPLEHVAIRLLDAGGARPADDRDPALRRRDELPPARADAGLESFGAPVARPLPKSIGREEKFRGGTRQG